VLPSRQGWPGRGLVPKPWLSPARLALGSPLSAGTLLRARLLLAVGASLCANTRTTPEVGFSWTCPPLFRVLPRTPPAPRFRAVPALPCRPWGWRGARCALLLQDNPKKPHFSSSQAAPGQAGARTARPCLRCKNTRCFWQHRLPEELNAGFLAAAAGARGC